MRKSRVEWEQLVAAPLVMPPPRATLRVKPDQLFQKHVSKPPIDVIETASFLATLSFVRQRSAFAFLARSVSHHFEREGVIKILRMSVPVELPPVGMITLRRQRKTASTEAMIECLRRAARAQIR